jgi:hypothetical protein
VKGKETEVIKKTKNITIKTQELTTFKVSNTSSTVELDINNSLSSQLNVAMNGSLKAPMPLIKTKGQDVTEQAEEAAKAEAARKEQAAQRAGLGVGKLIGAALLGLAAVAVIGAATAMTGGLALAVLGPTLAPMAAVAMQVTGVALAAAAISDGIEGAQDIAYAAQGDLDSHSYNPLRDGVFGGDAEAYANFETGLMILAALELEFAAPFVIAQQAQAQANRQAMQNSRASAGVGKTSTEYQSTLNSIRNKMPNTNLSKRGNMAYAEVDINGLKNEYIAHSKINSSVDKGADIADFSYLKPENERIFNSYVDDSFPRFHDTEAKILEDIASGIKNKNINGTVNLYSELPCCQSCSNIVLEFRRMFPNVKLNVIVGK